MSCRPSLIVVEEITDIAGHLDYPLLICPVFYPASRAS
jgi:hypothetical protein